jgi:uncharacterized protein YjfI (DUF2170 family)
MTNQIVQISQQLQDYSKQDDQLGLTVNTVTDNANVLEISIEDRQELPVYISISDEQILCITYLFTKEEIHNCTYMHQDMLSMNLSMPLSSFSKLNDQYILFGSLATSSSIANIVHEIITLSNNSLEAIKSMQKYLN